MTIIRLQLTQRVTSIRGLASLLQHSSIKYDDVFCAVSRCNCSHSLMHGRATQCCGRLRFLIATCDFSIPVAPKRSQRNFAQLIHESARLSHVPKIVTPHIREICYIQVTRGRHAYCFSSCRGLIIEHRDRF